MKIFRERKKTSLSDFRLYKGLHEQEKRRQAKGTLQRLNHPKFETLQQEGSSTDRRENG
jgi:hypothetical protein